MRLGLPDGAAGLETFGFALVLPGIGVSIGCQVKGKRMEWLGGDSAPAGGHTPGAPPGRGPPPAAPGLPIRFPLRPP